MTKGSCSCGAVTFTYTGEPSAKVACHCLACRKSSGNTHSINLLIPKSSLITNGPLKQWTRTGDSGKTVTNNFCATCGNLIVVDVDAIEGLRIVKFGLVDDVDALENAKPAQEIYCRNLLGWEGGLSGVERKDGAS